jgi:membrane protein
MALAPDRRGTDRRAVWAGSLVATILWVIASAVFSVYLSQFASYNKTWGSLAAVVVMLTWLWLGGVSLLFGAEIDAELERRRTANGPPDPPRLAMPVSEAPKGRPPIHSVPTRGG